MSPEPIVRAQALVVAMLLAASTILAAPLEALVISLAVGFVSTALRLKYSRDLRLTSSCLPSHRERLDLIVAGDLRSVLVLGIAASAMALAYDVDPIQGVGTARSVVVAVSVIAAVIYVSSLVDWYIILPRMSGQLGARPCRSNSEEPGVFPRTWRETTRWWYIHRIVAALTLRFGLSYAVTLAIEGFLTLGIERRVVVAAAVGGFASYGPLKLATVVREAGHPRLIVGRTVQRQRLERKVRWQLRIGRVSLFALHHKKAIPAETFAREYVFDVAVEGVQLVLAESREVPRAEDEEVHFERHPELIPLKDIDLADPATPFNGCDERCSGISWYCIENPRCFELK